MALPQSRTIHVALTFTDNYWALAYAVMRSICLTTVRRREVVFHLIHTEMQPRHLAILDRIPEEFSASLVHYDPEANAAFRGLVADLPATDRFPSIVYARLVLDKFLPPGTERVIYLDCDTMVVQPIEELFELDMGGHPIAAAFDPFHLGIKKGRDIKRKETPFDTGDRYFNSGVLLFDLPRYAEVDVPGRVKDMAASGALKNLFFDQDLLNLIFLHNWQPLHWRFNVLNPKPAHESLHVVILHYTAGQHPWHIYANVAFRRLYRHVMSNDVYYRFLAERWPKWLGPIIDRARLYNMNRSD